MGGKIKQILSTIANILLWAVIILAAFFSFATLATLDPNNVGNFLGYTPMSVQTDSMSPTFNSGDLIIVKKCDPATLEVGDIITFHTIIENTYALNTHRIQEIKVVSGYRYYVTKGDNNMLTDPETVADQDIVGKYVGRIPYFGKVMEFLQSKIGFLICILLPMLGFFIFQVYNLVQVAIKYKKAAALETAEEVAKVQAKAQAESQLDSENSELERMKRELEEAKQKLAEAQNNKAEEKTVPETQPEPEVKPEVEVKPEPVVEPQPEVKPEPVVKPQPEVKAEPAPEHEKKAEPDPVAEQQPEVKPVPEVKPEPVVKPQPEVKPEPKAEPKAAISSDALMDAIKAEKRAQILAAKKAKAAMLAEMEAEEESSENNQG